MVFNTDLIKMKISIKNAEKIFNDALGVLKGDIPRNAEDCKYCQWSNENQNLRQ